MSQWDDFDCTLANSLSQLPPPDEGMDAVTPWRRAMDHVVAGLCLTCFTLNFLGLQYLLPAVGTMELYLGARTLRFANCWFRWFFIISACKGIFLYINLVLAATPFQPHLAPLNALFGVPLTAALLICFRQGLRQITREAATDIRKDPSLWALVWYGVLILLALFRPNPGWPLFLVLVFAFYRIVRALLSAAAELAWSGKPDFSGGVIAHALGTDFGMGFLAPDGTIPEMPMELYDFLLDMGSFPQRELPAADLRSTRNENSGLPGARRYLGQAAAFRLAWDGDPALLDGFTQERAGLLTVPAEKRKPCLAHLMTQAAQGNAAAQEVFRRVGRHIGQINREMAPLLLPRTNVRYLFGRFVKEPACFRLLQEGCREIVPELVLEAADEELSVTPLMKALAAKGVTVAQFGQAIGAMYYAAMER